MHTNNNSCDIDAELGNINDHAGIRGHPWDAQQQESADVGYYIGSLHAVWH